MFKTFLIAVVSLFSLTSMARDKVIYGPDDRVDIYESKDALYVELALSTAAMIPGRDLTEDPQDQDQFVVRSSTLGDRGICEGEKFVEQPTAAFCSGFLVGPNLLVTAGHCIESFSKCKTFKWVFDYGYDVKGKNLSRVSKRSVYSCKKIIERKLENGSMNDYAFIELDRDVEGRNPLRFRTEGRAQKGDNLVVIGHPTGLPTKIADNAIVRRNNDDIYFTTNLDTFAGNSGSAVFNADTGLVEGILVRGATDYVRARGRSCKVPNECKDNSCRGEDVTRITNIEKLMQYASNR